jgi:hypothetical protein
MKLLVKKSQRIILTTIRFSSWIPLHGDTFVRDYEMSWYLGIYSESDRIIKHNKRVTELQCFSRAFTEQFENKTEKNCIHLPRHHTLKVQG